MTPGQQNQERNLMTPRPCATLLAFALASALSAAIAPEPARAAQIETKSYTIPSTEPGIQLFMRNKRPSGVSSFGPDRTLLFVHGATYPAETAFDLPIEGASMMDLFADAGYDVYLVDVRGYGGSTRPPAMSEPPEKNKPIVSTADAVSDFGSAVDHILKTRSLEKINVMGWSWGTSIVGAYTAAHNDKVNRLVLYAPLWFFKEGTRVLASGQLGAYRLVSKRLRQGSLAQGRAGGQESNPDPAGRVRGLGGCDLGDRSGRENQRNAARIEWRDPGRQRLLGGRQALLRSGEDHGADTADPCRMGRRPAELPGAGLLHQARQRALQAFYRNRRRYAYGDDGKEPHAVLP